MRRIIYGIVSCLIVIGGNAFATETVWKEWQNSLHPQGPAGQKLTLTEDGTTQYAIVCPDNATSQEGKAAEDLAYWLREITGATFSTFSDRPVSSGRIISIGKTKSWQDSNLPDTTEGLGDEGYTIQTSNSNLFLLGGRTRGIINAVYAFLEEDVGCRWYTPDIARIPQTRNLTIQPTVRTFVPKLKIRDPFYKAAFEGQWSLRNRTNSPCAPVPEKWGGYMDYVLFVHTMHQLVPPSEYFEKHPEYYMLNSEGTRIARQLCQTNPDAIRIATENALRLIREHPEAEIISISKIDGGGSCCCERCRAIDEEEESQMGSLLYFVNRVAEAIEREFPNVTVSTLAYLETVKPPKHVRPRKNMAIRLCTDNCMWEHPFTPARESPVFHDSLVDWAQIHNRIHIWDYVVNFSHYTAPMPNMMTVADNIRFFVENNVEGVMLQGAYQSQAAERDRMRSWVFAKLLWDPTLDSWELMQDFAWGYYGKAAPYICRYYQLLMDTAEIHHDSLQNPKGGIRYGMDDPFLSDDFRRNALRLLKTAERKAENEEIRHRVELEKLPLLYVQLCRGLETTGKRYQSILEEFETIARREGLTHIFEGPPDLEAKLEEWKKNLESNDKE
ncbi:MAG: DUF4838 domain-containing protein [bacterium]